jgi:tetratricopeptide (TPR) repeat protein
MEAARRTAEPQAEESSVDTAVLQVIADASQHAALEAAAASREAERAAANARSASGSSRDDGTVARREAERARAAAERALEALDEVADRPARVVSVATSTSTPGTFQAFRRSMRAESSYARGSALLEARNYAEAREHLGEATLLYPEHDRARALLAWCDYFLGDFRGAVVGFKAALRRQPTWEGLHNGLGWSRLRLGRPHLAAAAFRPALERKPEYVDALHGLGSALLQLGQYDTALPSLQKALRGSQPLIGDDPPETAVIRAKIAWSLYYLERYREALAAFIRASLAAPESPQLHAGQGWCYIKLGQKSDARAAFKRALDLRPDDEVLRDALQRASL